jgi:hypothetical protein
LVVRGNRSLLGLDYEEVDQNTHDDARDHNADNRPVDSAEQYLGFDLT